MKLISEDLLCELSFFNDKSDKEKLKFLKENMKRGLERLDFKLTVCKEIKSFTSFKSWYHAAKLLTDIVNQNDVLINYFERRLRES